MLLQPTRALWLEQGRIVGAASDAAGERPLDVGRKLGLLTAAQHAAMEPATAGMGSRRVGVLLLEQGLLDASELAVLARARALEVVAGVLATPAPHRFTPGAPVPASERVVTSGSALAVAVEVLRRRLTPERVDALLGGPDSIAAPASGAPPLEAVLAQAESLLASRADGLRTVQEIAADANGGDVRALLAALVEVGVLQVTHLAPPAAERVAPTAADLARAAEKLREAHGADYFTLLGLEPAATARAAAEAADRIAGAMDPARYPSAPPGLAEELALIREVVADARAVLCDPALGPAYARALAGHPAEAHGGVANAGPEW